MGFAHQIGSKERSLNVIGAPILHLFGAENESDVQVTKTIFPMYQIEKSLVVSRYIIRIQPTRAFILSSVLAQARSTLEKAKNKFSNLILDYVQKAKSYSSIR